MADRLVLNKVVLGEIAQSTEVVVLLESVAQGSASRAAARANEKYTVSTVHGKKRAIVRVTGQEPNTGGFYRGKATQALWHSRPSYGGNR